MHELLLLEELQGRGHVSQRRLGERLGMAGSLVNRLIGRLRDDGHVEVVDRGVRPFAYRLTARGRRHRAQLCKEHCRDVLRQFKRLKRRIRGCLNGLKEDGIERLVLYGSGDLACIIASSAADADLQVVGVVDEGESQAMGEEGTSQVAGFVVDRPAALQDLAADAVLNASFVETEKVRELVERAVGTPGPPVVEL